LVRHPNRGGKHDPEDFAQELVLTPQTPFDLDHQFIGEAQIMERLLHDRSGVLRLAAITCEALLRCEATTESGFDLLFGISFRGRHGKLLSTVWIVCGRFEENHIPPQ
jgi:hypothetical protein